MSQIVVTEIVEAPADVVWEQVMAAVEAPERFLPGIVTLALDEESPTVRLRRTDVGGWIRTERILIDADGLEARFTLFDDPLAAGGITARVFQHGEATPSLALMEFEGRWRPLSARRGAKAVEVLEAECRALATALRRAAEITPRR